MKNSIKHLLMLCLFGMISIGAMAYDFSADNSDGVTIYYNITSTPDLTCEVTQSNYSKYSGEVKIPSRVTYNSNSYSVTSIGERAFGYCSGLTSIEIPNSVTTIESTAFYGCSGLTSVIIPHSVTSIEDSAFGNCSGLKSVTIPNSVTSIGGYAFEGCSGLTSVTIPNSVTSIGREAFLGCSGLTSVTIGNSVTTIGREAFLGCSGLTSVTIPISVTSIGYGAFDDCSGLTSVVVESGDKVYDSRDNCNAIIETASNTLVTGCKNTTIPNSVTSIGNSAFFGCSGLTSVTIPNSVTTIEKYAFYGCSGLTSVTIPNSVTSIGVCAFTKCSGLTSVNITDLDKWAEIEFESSDANPLDYAHNLYLNEQLVTEAKLTTATKIGDYAFDGCSGLTSVTIPNSVTSIGGSAFYNCSGLTSVTIPESVTSIGSFAFYGCSGLTSVTIPNSVTSIGWYVFYDCSGLTSVTIPNSVTSIGIVAFEGCSGLTSVTIGNSVTSIGDEAFWGCSGLTSIIADGVNAPTIGTLCFNHVTYCTLHAPSGSEESYTSNFGEYFGAGNSYGNTIAPYSSYSKSSAGEYSFENWNASSDVVLGEGIEKVYVPVEATVGSLQYKRTFNNTDWQALYVPFELDVVNDLADFSVYEISTSLADAINVTLMTEGKTSANTPYLIKAKATGEKAISVSSKKVEVTMENTNSDLSDFEIVGTYAKLKYGDISGDWYALKGGKFMKAGEGAYLNPYRFYLKRKASSAKENIEININEPTGITLYENPSIGSGQAQNENGVIYNLNGMRVDSNYKGIVIINGKKYLKK